MRPGDGPMRPTRRHPTPVLEKCGDRRVAVRFRAAATFKDSDGAETLQLDQPRDQLQFDQITGHLVDVQPVDIVGLSLLQSRP